ncbi:dentin sialophosphoprotein [Zea mays]|uniref:Micronuclear linker histone polyprotein-like protein n=1 Tax=Zea mays TaxID=4577 RepID=A0A1D6JFB4_MAIZE|nr:dentin sialophosphoprotein [Zea mays]AQK46470.1 Micronuclear linker histone polyprotein-like protein [Zea mays]|eukprot:XP_020401360.1 dentin sialophosphoprotein [Zea mays]
MEASKHRPRKHRMGSNKRVPPYLLLVLLAVGAAAVSVGILHKMRERRVLAVLVQERDQQLISFQVLLEKEKEINKEMRRKVDELEAKTSALSIERAELKNKLMDSETTTTYLTNTQKELEAALVEKESHINQMKESAAAANTDQTTTIKELLQQKEAGPELDKSESYSDSIPATSEDNSNSNTISESRHNDESIVAGANTENATSETVVLDKSENSSDSIPVLAEQENSINTNPSDSSQQDESIVVEARNDNATSNLVVLDKSENTNGSVPVTEEQNSYSTTAWESNQQDNSSSQEQFLKLTTNIEDGHLQENKGDANEQSDDTPEGSHSDKSELQQGNQTLIDNQEASKEESDSTRQVENPQDEASNHSRESKVLEKENEKEINREGTSSEVSLSEASQNKTQAVEPVVDPTDVNPSTSTNNERRETSKRHRRRRSRSRRNRKATVEIDATANP